jgi:hypothetical protein
MYKQDIEFEVSGVELLGVLIQNQNRFTEPKSGDEMEKIAERLATNWSYSGQAETILNWTKRSGNTREVFEGEILSMLERTGILNGAKAY